MTPQSARMHVRTFIQQRQQKKAHEFPGEISGSEVLPLKKFDSLIYSNHTRNNKSNKQKSFTRNHITVRVLAGHFQTKSSFTPSSPSPPSKPN